jgi:hypothetical protein
MRRSDFTEMGSAGVTIAGQPLDHHLYHFQLANLRQRTTPPAFPLKTCYCEGLRKYSRIMMGVGRDLATAAMTITISMPFQ